MRFKPFLPLALLLVVGCNALHEDANPSDLARLQGTWNAVMFADADKLAQGNGGLRLTISGDRFAVTLEDRTTAEGTIRVDANRSPKTIDFIDDNHVGTGIYRLYGEELRICYDPVGTVRPTRFEVPSDSALKLLILKRGKS
jgi:uncharacterized protein (TIGR03067 family)